MRWQESVISQGRGIPDTQSQSDVLKLLSNAQQRVTAQVGSERQGLQACMHGFLGFGHKEHTAEERVAAVQELRQRLTTNPGNPSVLAQLQHTHEAGIGDGWDDQTLLRWLTAETFHVDRAEARIRKNAAWRAEYIPKGFILKAGLARPSQKKIRLNRQCCRVLVGV